MEMLLRIALIVVIVVATTGYASSQDTCEYAPNSREMALEMQTLLAGLNNKVADLTETVQKQGSTIAKLKAKLSKINQTNIATEARLNATNEELQSVRTEELTARIENNRTLEALTNLINSVKAQDIAVNIQHNAAIEQLNSAIDDLRAEGQDIVAFSAHSISSTELSSGDKVIYPRVDTNIGNHYNGQTSVFTCPYTGLYSFHVSVLSYHSRSTGLRIMIDSASVAYAYADGDGNDDWDSGSALTIHRCEAGSEVYVRCRDSGRLGTGGVNRFTGLLINKL